MKNSPGGNIRFLLAAILLTFVLTDSAFAQTEKEIIKVRGEVAVINKGAPKYTKTTKNVEDISLEGTEATYYSAAGDVRKITAKIYGESYNAAGEFYYLGGTLIFAYLKHNQYDAPIGTGKSPKVARTEERRFYFADGELIRLLIGKKILKSGDERHSRLKDEIIGISSKLKSS